jgi:competence protein ComEC
LTFLFFLNILAWSAVFNLSQSKFLEVNFFYIGQGDSIFIETPNKEQILIDGGPDSTILEKLGKEMPFWDRSIDLVILTHPEHDHMAGLIEVLKRYKVDNILWTGVVRDTAEYREWLEVIENEGAEIKIARAGQRITLLNSNIDIFYPFESLEGQESKNSNNTSIVARLVFGENSFLFTGDAIKSVERKLIKAEINIDSDILKAGHHGSKTSSAKEFIEAVSPEIVVISVGKDNKFDHPHQETLDNVSGIKVLRTDLMGDIKIISDGIQLNYLQIFRQVL